MNWRNIILAAVILLGPVILILLFRTGTTEINQLEVLGPYEIKGTDTVHHTVDYPSIGLTIGEKPFEQSKQHILLHIDGGEDPRISELAEENIAKLIGSEEALKTNDFKIYTLSLSPTLIPDSDYRGLLDLYTGTKENLSKHLLFGEWKDVDLGMDNIGILIDKDGRIRAYYYVGNGRFHKEFLGNLNVLRHEYSHK